MTDHVDPPNATVLPIAERLRSAERERDEARACWSKAERDVTMLRSELDTTRAELEHLREVVEMTCGRCWGLGLIPAENFGHDADGAPWTDEEQPCPDGCEIPRWLQAERNDAADDARLLGLARSDLAELRAARGWIVARDGGRDCERCEGEIRRGEAYELLPGSGGLLAHIHCPTPNPRRADDV